MRYLSILLFVLSMLGCGFNTNYISSAPTIGEKTRGPISIIREPEVSVHLRPRNDLKTGELNYVVMPVVPVGGNSDEVFVQKQTKGRFVVGLSLFANQENLALNFSDIALRLQDSTFKAIDVVRNPYANYTESQARHFGDEDVLCPKSQKVSSELFNKDIELTSNGLWQCYDLVFPVSAPSPRISFQIVVIIKDKSVHKDKTIIIPFVSSEWGHSDSFP
jgi:hypothetical protein